MKTQRSYSNPSGSGSSQWNQTTGCRPGLAATSESAKAIGKILKARPEAADIRIASFSRSLSVPTSFALSLNGSAFHQS